MYENRDRPATTLSLMPSASAVRSGSPVRSVNGTTATCRSEALASEGVLGLGGAASASARVGTIDGARAAGAVSASRNDSRNWACTSRAVWQRSFTSFSRQRLMASPSRRGKLPLSSVTAGGWSLSIDAISAAEVSPRNGRLPVAISYSTTPSENTSVRWSNGRPSTCSGDMYGTVPRTCPSWVIHASVGRAVASTSSTVEECLARPKSSTFTCLSVVTMTLAGFKSRCTMPRSCAAATASASGTAIASSSAAGMPAAGINRLRARPVTSSMVRK